MQTQSPEIRFINNWARDSAARHFACVLLSETRFGNEVTERRLEYLAATCGLSACGKDKIIDAAIDANLVRATMIDAHNVGFGLLPAIVSV